MVGAGTMGGQIAYQAALHGFDVHLVSRKQELLEAAREASFGSCCVDASRREGSTATRARLPWAGYRSARICRRWAGRGVVIESVAEDRDTKREVFQRISEYADEHAIIGTNSSTLASSLLEDSVTHAERFLNIHFFNPALVMALVEVVPGPHTAEETTVRAVEFVRAIGKTPVRLAREEYGFIANRVLFIAIQEAMQLVQGGYISVADCDLAVRNGLGWPMGPFELSDLVGLDVVEAILDEGARQTGDPRWEPVELLRDLVRRGQLGNKTGGGFVSGTP